MFEAFQFGPFLLRTHLFFLVLGIWLSIEFFLRLSISANFSLQHFQSRWWEYLLSMFLGGRLLAIVAEYRTYWHDPFRVFMLHDGGFSFFGMAVGVAMVIFIHCRKSRVTFLQWLDVLLPATTFGMSFDWLGKFAAGQAFGSPTDMFWAVTYDTSSVKFTYPIHPVQLYYAFFYFFLTFILLIVRKHTTRAGAETLFGIVLAALATMFFELFRGDAGIPVLATKLDFLYLLCLFLSMGIFAAFELKLSQRAMIAYEVALTLVSTAYFIFRRSFGLLTYQLRFTQFLALLALIATVVYVVVHRRRHPHL